MLRSLQFGDDDYSGNVLEVLGQITRQDPSALAVIEKYLTPESEGEYVSEVQASRIITFAPTVFQVPEGGIEYDLVSVMMSFDASFNGVYKSIQAACKTNCLRCERADNVWDHSTIIQDIFNLIFKSRIVIVDFTQRNPNVLFETGIAHTLGRTVVPISQSKADIPFDLAHHRFQLYLANTEGLGNLSNALATKLKNIVS